MRRRTGAIGSHMLTAAVVATAALGLCDWRHPWDWQQPSQQRDGCSRPGMGARRRALRMLSTWWGRRLSTSRPVVPDPAATSVVAAIRRIHRVSSSVVFSVPTGPTAVTNDRYGQLVQGSWWMRRGLS